MTGGDGRDTFVFPFGDDDDDIITDIACSRDGVAIGRFCGMLASASQFD